MNSRVIIEAIDALFERIAESVRTKNQPNQPANLERIDLLQLESLFNKALLERALLIVYGKRPIVIYQSPDKANTLVEVPGSDAAIVYKHFPSTNYCCCESFRCSVVKHKSQALCKHLLATRLALALNRIQVIPLPNDTIVDLKRQFISDFIEKIRK
ncbi:zinc finger SWIM domain-containing protein 7-like [Anopheles bellator]|uniref:zinc finger SWIM domain-containing protein 7-like n=1 Tax=Anopheles bellator TaxID=139047 RepID=UPI0026496EAE|nr:zinc finger SWIM domain-containing protein 7-like [Anopheles bellator]